MHRCTWKKFKPNYGRFWIVEKWCHFQLSTLSRTIRHRLKTVKIKIMNRIANLKEGLTPRNLGLTLRRRQFVQEWFGDSADLGFSGYSRWKRRSKEMENHKNIGKKSTTEWNTKCNHQSPSDHVNYRWKWCQWNWTSGNRKRKRATKKVIHINFNQTWKANIDL